jgi:transcriptional regulator with XRE-family HTH domain
MSESPKITGAGSVIRELREGKNVTLPELADSLGWDKGRLSKYETDQRGLSVDVIEEIAEALDLRPEAVVLQCLKRRYPKLAEEGSEIGTLVNELVAAIQKAE